jgi:hypothetical protein
MGAVTRFASLAGILIVAVTANSSVAAKVKPHSTVADLRYGVALYHYYQQDYMTALSELLVAKQRGGIQGHGDNPEIMEGGFALAYGIDNYAAEIFEDVLAKNVSEEAQVTAWYYLAKMRYQRRDWQASYKSMARVTELTTKNRDSAERVGADLTELKINLAIKQDDLEQAEYLLKREPTDDAWLPYAWYNVGTGWARRQNFTRAVRFFDLIAEQSYSDPERRALYDKAMTSAGYSLLLSGKFQLAMEKFSSVRLNSPVSGRALLGYGWAAVELENYAEALKVWKHLSAATYIDENAQEALVAVPYAYEKMGNDGLALKYFQEAERNYLDEMNRLDEVIENLKGEALLEALNLDADNSQGWVIYAEKHALTPQLSYLVSLFSRQDFQLLVQDLRDLIAIHNNIQTWRERLGFYTGMLDERETDRLSKATLIEAGELKQQIGTLERQRSELAQTVEKMAAEKDYFALVDEDQADLIERVTRSLQRVPRLRASDPFIDESEEALRRYYGLLMWDTSEQFSARMWQAIKSLNTLDETIKILRRNYKKIEQIVNQAPDLQPYRDRISTAEQTLENQSASVDLVLKNTQERLRLQVVTELSAQRDRLQHYLAQSRLSIARLLDKTLMEANNIVPAQVPMDSSAVMDEEPENKESVNYESENAVATP